MSHFSPRFRQKAKDRNKDFLPILLVTNFKIVVHRYKIDQSFKKIFFLIQIVTSPRKVQRKHFSVVTLIIASLSTLSCSSSSD